MLDSKRSALRLPVRHVVGAVLAIFVAGIAQAQVRRAIDEWQLSSPGEQGLDAGLLSELVERLRSEEKSVRSVVVVRNGRLVLEYYREGLGPLTLHNMHSATLCVVSTLVGIAIQKQFIRGLDQPIADFLPEARGAGANPSVKTITLGHILAMTAGFDPAAIRVGESTSVDFSRSLVSEPGTTFSFNPDTGLLAARVLVSATQETAQHFAQKRLFGPLGIQRYQWEVDKPGADVLGYSGLHLSARDMAKLGQLQLQHGTWSGKALVPAGYAEAATRRQSAGGAPMHWGYGYAWWVAPPSRLPAPYMAGADDGQRIYVNPGMRLVVVVASDTVGGLKPPDDQVDMVIREIVFRVVKR